MQTRDEFLESGKGYKKPGYENKGYYRRVGVIDTNNNDELAVAKLYGHSGEELSNYKNGKSRVKHHIEVKDDEGKPIKVGKKFILNPSKDNLSNADVNFIKNEAFLNAPKKIRNKNNNKLKFLKNRK